MVKEILMSEFNKQSLEERTQLAIIHYFWKGTPAEINIKLDVPSLADTNPYLEAWANAEENNYVEIVGGTPKSGAAYKITKKGLDFVYGDNKSKEDFSSKIKRFLMS